MSNSFLRAVNSPRLLFSTSSVYGWGTSSLYYDISNDLLMFATNGRGFFNTKTGVRTFITSNNTFPALNYCYYNGYGISISIRSTGGNLNKTILVDNSNNSAGSYLTNSWPIPTTNLVITGCAVYNNTFYVIGTYSNDQNKLIVMQTGLSTTNPANPFNTTTPSFTQTYQTFTSASRIYGDYSYPYSKYTGMCTFDPSGNLYITTYGSGVYRYPVGSSFASNPSIFITATNIYSTILYNNVLNVFYILNATSNSNSIDVYSRYGELVKLNYITGLFTPGTNGENATVQMCCDPLGGLYYEGTYTNIFTVEKIVCFKKDTLILTFQGYKRIQDLKKGDLVKTLKHEYVPIYKIGYSEIHHTCNLEERTKDQLYKCSNTNYPEVFEDLVLTGCHSILVDEIKSEEQMEKIIEVNGDLYVTDNKYRLPVCLDERATVYDVPGNHTIYHMALENDDYYMNYGIYANGLLVESTSKRFMDTIKMTLVE